LDLNALANFGGLGAREGCCGSDKGEYGECGDQAAGIQWDAKFGSLFGF
jgi:hypothetical protein